LKYGIARLKCGPLSRLFQEEEEAEFRELLESSKEKLHSETSTSLSVIETSIAGSTPNAPVRPLDSVVFCLFQWQNDASSFDAVGTQPSK
jgi:hypothetical protein